MRLLSFIIAGLIFQNLIAASYIEDQIKKLENYKLIVLERSKLFLNTEKVVCQNLSLSLGECYPDMSKLRSLLMIKGYLLDEKIKDDYLFDDSLKNAVEHFQKQNRMNVTGVLDTKTCKILNQSFDDEISMINKNIKRLESLKCSLQNNQKTVLINVPQYNLLCIDGDCVEKEINVIVGRPGRETNLKQDQILAIQINPSWTIPEGILKDKIKTFSKNPNYLDKNGYSVLDEDGDELEPNSIDWNQVRKNPTLYRFKQNPGKKNALGLYKFVLNNPENIHIHGTNQQNLFNKENRSISSGCIRVEDPKEFAKWLLKGQKEQICRIHSDNLKQDCLEKVFTKQIQKKSTQRIRLKNPVRVLFSYITMWIDEHDRVFKSDPYGKDLA
ncbi:MAG: L,D-transpeptidase family protein [Proteobacteria bacterium]|nr:L,D-transpeptidase family protein [Pseudomonadota bacterium]